MPQYIEAYRLFIVEYTPERILGCDVSYSILLSFDDQERHQSPSTYSACLPSCGSSSLNRQGLRGLVLGWFKVGATTIARLIARKTAAISSAVVSAFGLQPESILSKN